MANSLRSFCWLVIGLMPVTLLAQSFTLSGRIFDKESGEALEYASVTLYSLPDSSLIHGVVTDKTGMFSFSQLANQELFVSAQFLGYQAFYSDKLTLTESSNLGDIFLSLPSTTLDEVEVIGRALSSVHQVDRQVYDARQFSLAQGGSATDVLANLPAISINALGEISVRGTTGFLLMVNGKPVQTDPSAVLSQLPANTIQDIEIITAPSAKYDPDGHAGIINILTRQAVLDGIYVLSNVLLGLPSIEDYDNAHNAPRYGADVTVNYKKQKWEWAAGLDYRRYDISGRREGYVNTYLNGILTEFPSDGERSFDEENYSVRLSATFSPSKRQSITAGFYAGKRTKERTADILYLNQQRLSIAPNDFLDPEAYYDRYLQSGDVLPGGNVVNTLTYFNENLRVRRGDFLIGSLEYSFQFSENATLKLSGLYEYTILGGPTDNANLDYPNTDRVLQLQLNDNDNPLDGVRLKADYSQKLGKLLWESGYQYRYLKHPGDFDYFDRDLDNNTWIENPLFTNRIDLSREIHAVYSQLSGKTRKWEYTGGLRVEYFDRKVEIARPEATFKLDRLNLFPSLNLSYDLGKGMFLKGGYSRRIQRTTTFKMTPFPEREHSETLEQGDAELLPEYIDLVEVGGVKNWNDHSVFGNLYYRRINNVINRVNNVFNDTILNRIYTNVGKADVWGVELGTTIYPVQGWRLYVGGNVYRYQIRGELFGDNINTSNTVFSLNATSDINLSPSLSLQLALNYLSERITAQGRDSRFYNPSLSLKKSFWDKKINVTLQWRNIDLGLLNSNEQRITTVRNNFFTTTNYVYEVDILQLSVSFQLNKASKKPKLLESEFGKQEF